MSLTYMKNKVTGELRKVEAGGREYLDLAAERLSGHKDSDGNAPYADQSHRPLWEDRGVAGHAEADEQPAKGNVNRTNYDDALVGAEPELGIDPDLVQASGDDREVHSKVVNSGTDPKLADREEGTVTADDKKDDGGSGDGQSQPPGTGSTAPPPSGT